MIFKKYSTLFTIILPIKTNMAFKRRQPQVHCGTWGFSFLIFYDAEKEFAETGEYVDSDVAFAELEKKYFNMRLNLG